MLKALVTESSHWTGFDLPGRALGQAEAVGYARACLPQGNDAELHFLAVQIAVMTAFDDAFDSVRQPISPDALASLIPWRRPSAPAPEPDWAAMRDALAALDSEIKTLARVPAVDRAGVCRWWRRMAEQQIAAFACEAAWRLEGRQPTLKRYVRIGEQSIGVEWTAAALVALDAGGSVPRAGSLLAQVIGSIARAIRLANDLHDPERERGEGKVQWLLLRAAQLMERGLSVQNAERQATVELRAAASAEVASAHAMLRGTTRHELGGTAALRASLEGLLAVGLRTYVPDLAAA